MALGALHAAGFDVESEQILALLGVQPGDARVVSRMIERKINTPQTSSLGRLFDAVAAVVLGHRTVDYEAQAAIELEAIAIHEADRFEQGDYVPELHAAEKGSGSVAVIRTGKMWKAILDDIWRGVPASRLPRRFHAGIAEGFINAAGNLRIESGINQVAMSGGCMHNRRLSRLLRSGLEEEGFTAAGGSAGGGRGGEVRRHAATRPASPAQARPADSHPRGGNLKLSERP